uniref:Uncharacterized protein n=1 Tax=Timema shepardi TaxID=629360 RepID=A0A7R9B586_TIMSH|nr:unnamed protein product [Timema shepardi]
MRGHAGQVSVLISMSWRTHERTLRTVPVGPTASRFITTSTVRSTRGKDVAKSSMSNQRSFRQYMTSRIQAGVSKSDVIAALYAIFLPVTFCAFSSKTRNRKNAFILKFEYIHLDWNLVWQESDALIIRRLALPDQPVHKIIDTPPMSISGSQSKVTEVTLPAVELNTTSALANYATEAGPFSRKWATCPLN